MRRIIAALLFLAWLGQPSHAPASEADAILADIIATTQKLARLCTSIRPAYFCSFVQSASLDNGRLRIVRTVKALGSRAVTIVAEVEAKVESVYVAVDPDGEILFLYCKTADCIEIKRVTECESGGCKDGKIKRRAEKTLLAVQYEEHRKLGYMEEILRQFERLSALCDAGRC
jgi:hypothetical protein